ncbi:MAG: urea transporter [Marinilabiliaceae bacterium]|jgi:urea transporter|nr:urea transporter [Marinilabiliaceae bacterium]
MIERLKIYLKSFLNSYSQVFFSDSRFFALALVIVSFADLYAGVYGLISVITTNLVAYIMGFDKRTVSRGLYGFNSLLVGLGLGIYYQPSLILTVIILFASILTLFLSVSMQGIIGKYGLPYLSVPFIIGAWIVTLATREFTSLGISERGIFTLNNIYTLGGLKMLNVYEWWNGLEFARPLKIYFISLGAILFQYNILAGLIISLALLLHSRIAFTLSLLGFFTAYLFYEFTGASITDLNYSYIGFNYILSSIAVGGFFIIPSWKSYLWSIILVPLVAILTISMASVFAVFALPVFALPFNIIVLLFLYILKFRIKPSESLAEVVIQQNSPEKNLYSYTNAISRFRPGLERIKLPFYGSWTVSQGHDGDITHKGEWRHAWDFIITDAGNSQFKNEGKLLEDYYCYGKPVVAPADGEVVYMIDNIPDNSLGVPNVKENWGNTVIIRHNDYLFSSLSHLVPGSINVKEGQKIREGEIIGRCGNSGRSPYPHLHFQLQSTPYIGSKTLAFPLAYYIDESGSNTGLMSFDYPVQDHKVSNIRSENLLKQAFDFIPGRELNFKVSQNGTERMEKWEVLTDEYNNLFISSTGSGSRAYFENDGNMLMFKHYDGRRKDLLYWFYLSHYKVPLGFYNNFEVIDNFPLDLFVKPEVRFLNDFIAPFTNLIKSVYRLRYVSVDNEISPSEIVIESDAANSVIKKLTRKMHSRSVIGEKGIKSLLIDCGKIKISAECD